MLVLADTGILLRLLERTDPQHAVVRGAVRLLRSQGDTLVAAPQNLAEFWNVCTRPAAARGGLGLPLLDTERRLRLLERLFQVLPDHPAAYAIWRQLVVGNAVSGVQVPDARLVAWMRAHGITHLLTLNPGDFARYQGITAVTPQGILTAPPSP
jgi:predicted nucleic acid-binding protein